MHTRRDTLLTTPSPVLSPCQPGPVMPLRALKTVELPRAQASHGSAMFLETFNFTWDIGVKVFTE